MKSTHRYNKSIEVFDVLCGNEFYYAECGRNAKFLRAMAKAVWAQHGRKNYRCPRVIFLQVPKQGGSYLNWCEGQSLIAINRACQNISTLLHEMVHALGYYKHSSGFVRKYADLMSEYGKCDYAYMMVLAKMAGTV